MYNVVEGLPFGIVAKSTTSGTGDFALSGNAPYALDATDLVDGQRVFYHRFYSDFSTVAVEGGRGKWHAGSGEIREKVILKSSVLDVDDVPQAINWSAEETYVGVYVTAEEIAQWAAVQTDHPPGAPNLIAMSGQSDIFITPNSEGTFPEIPAGFVKDLCTDLIGPYAITDTLSFKDYVSDDETYEYPTNPYVGISRSWYGTEGTRFYQDDPPTSTAIGDLWFDTNDNGHPYKAAIVGADQIAVGEWESIEGDAGWARNAHWGVLYAYWLALQTARLSLTVCAASSGAVIDNATLGWQYNPGSGNTADVLNDAIAIALASSECTAWNITAPHVFIMDQGPLDATGGKSSQQYAMYLSQFIDAIFDSNRWGWAVDGVTKAYIPDIPDLPNYRDSYPEFQGHALACSMHPTRCTLVPMNGQIEYYHTWDPVHSNDRGAAFKARRVLNAHISTSGTVFQSDGTVIFDRGSSEVTFLTTLNTDDDTTPSANNCNLNVAEDTLLIHKTQNTGGTDLTYSGLGGCVKNPATHPDDAYFKFEFLTTLWELDINGPVVEHADYYEVPVTVRTSDTTDGFTQFTIHDFEAPPKPIEGYRAFSGLPMAASNLQPGQEVDNESDTRWLHAVANDQGQIVRLGNPVPMNFPSVQISGSGTHRVWSSVMTDHNATDDLVLVEATVVGRKDGDNTQTFAYRVSRVMRKTATTWAAHGSTDVKTIEDYTTSLTWEIETHNTGVSHNVALRTPGLVGEDLHVSGHVIVTKIEEAA